jgi:hypothetical protein
MMAKIKTLPPAAALCLLFLSGCGQGDRPPLGTVHGTVMRDGRPLAGAMVLFEPVEPGRGSIGVTGDDGGFELHYLRKDKGAKVGMHVVRITTGRQGNAIPARYNTQSMLKEEVKRGDNRIDFRLTSR